MSSFPGFHRREFLRIGSAGFAGLSLASLLRAEGAAGPDYKPARAKALIFIYLAGGPSHHETFDPKPLAPMRIRGPWGTIATSVPGTLFGEMLPQLAEQAERFALLRALNHTNGLHNPWPVMTGNMQQRTTLPAAVSFLKREGQNDLPAFVNLGPKLSIGTGALGPSYEPLEIADPTRAHLSLADFRLTQDVDPDRLDDRETLLRSIDQLRRRADLTASLKGHDQMHQRALSLLTSNRVRDAFDLAQEPEVRRDRFGANSFGQSCLLARRLIEAGTGCVQINWYNREDGFAVGWDVHGDDQTGLVRMEQQLCPRFDQGMSALLDDLHERGMLDSTLVIATGEFGRTPRISRLGGRDHWPYCFSALVAGGGVPGGRVVGSSDAQGAYPADRPVTPADLAATTFELLGVNPNQDDRLRSMVFEGHAIEELCG
ncbi:MAG TPA: DUF1501 domain-containing protein [Pirellulales bacterium]|nr:DUF1501 domain-containing protein [Pirellulales bacterium]